MKMLRPLSFAAALILLPVLAFAGFTDTLPKGAFLLDESFAMSYLDSRWDDNGRRAPLIDPIERYEPGGGMQGLLIPKAKIRFGVLINQLHYGILDNLTCGVIVPVVMYSIVEPNLEWKPGDYQWGLGRPYGEEDFWQWAESMGQPKPEPWSGNHGVLADIVLLTRYRFTDGIAAFKRADAAMSFTVTGSLPTSTQADPENLLGVGTTTWDLHSNGELGLHLSADKFFSKSLGGHLTLGVDAFYEFLFPHRYITPEGKVNPLLLNYRPYVGRTYVLDPGDFTGGSFQVDVVPWKGPAKATWLTKGDAEKAAALPPSLTLSLRYTFNYLQQSDWKSNSEIWDYEREKLWRPGYKNILYGQATLSLLRFGIPAQPYAGYRNQEWIHGKNARAVNVVTLGSKFLLKFW